MKEIDAKPVHVLSVLVAVSLLFSGFTALKMVEIEEEMKAISDGQQGEQEQRFSLPTGTPALYGDELSVQYQDVSKENPDQAEQVIQEFASYDSITLSGETKQRYINILYEMKGGISCEYCCEARSVITKNGEPGCGCAHAVAMRGLTKYLLTNHGDEMTDSEIFQEVAKWKTRFFPTQTTSKAAGLQEQDVSTTFVNLASNEYRGVSSDKGGWVGDC